MSFANGIASAVAAQLFWLLVIVIAIAIGIGVFVGWLIF